jgi:hypothetical protein
MNEPCLPRRPGPLIALSLLWLLPAAVDAQDPPRPPEARAPAADEAAGQRAAAGEPEADAPASPAAPPSAGKGSPQRFEPTEKVRADFDVAFPVDI